MGRLMFGKQESINEIQDIPLQGPEGEDLILGYRTSSYFVGAGVYLKDDGYVLGVKGEDAYFPLEQEYISELQAAGDLPEPLPAYSIALLDYAFGYSLWIIIVGIVFYEFIKRRLFPKNSHDAHAPSSS